MFSHWPFAADKVFKAGVSACSCRIEDRESGFNAKGKEILVSSEAVWLGLGASIVMAGMGGVRHIPWFDGAGVDVAPLMEPCCLSGLCSGYKRLACCGMLVKRRATEVALGQALKDLILREVKLELLKFGAQAWSLGTSVKPI